MNDQFGIRLHFGQFSHQLIQVLFVGLMIGMMRTVVPAVAETEFGVPEQSFVLLATFVVAFGLVKSILNFVAGRLSERIGRKTVLVLGWAIALPIPLMIYFAPNWGWIVAATVLLGVNQGFTWSMTQTSKIDLARSNERGLAIGLNESFGYVGVAIAGIITAYLAAMLGNRPGLLLFGLVVAGGALLLALVWGRDTLGWAHAEARAAEAGKEPQRTRSGWEVFAIMSWRDRRMAAVSQAGLVEKFVDALVWVLYPVFLVQRGVDLPTVGWIVGVYGFTWGFLQLVTGKWSDHIGRHRLNVGGMLICGAGVGMMLLAEGVAWWSVSAAVSGVGMAMLYPNLSAVVADLAHPRWRGSAIGIYRFWRDLGYAIGALAFAIAAHIAGQIEAAFVFVTLAMFASGLWLWWFGEESHPELRSATE